MSEEIKHTGSNTRKVSLRNLYLDPNNFRLIHEMDQINVDDSNIKEKDVSSRTYRLILGEKNHNIQDLIDSFKANGYLPVDQIQVRELENGGFVVVEGNRRVAALKFLQAEHNEKSIDLGKLDPSIFSRVPVVIYDDPDEVHHLTLMALKHISGNRKWGEWNQAKLLDKMLKLNANNEDEVCRRVGISKTELRRSLRALALADQYQQSDYGDQFRESMFPIFREAARNTALKDWIGWDESESAAKHLENRELFFSWLSKEPVEEDSDSNYSGNVGEFYDPAISKRDDIVTLSKIVRDPHALEKLKEYRNLNEAFRTSDLIFREKINDAINSVVSDVNTLGQLSISQDQVPELEQALGRLRGIVEKARSSNLRGVEQNTVFYDRIDDHFTSIEVLKHRGLSNLKVNELSRINVFAGINNSGKTSLLEAIYLLAKQNDFNGIVDVLRRRGKIPGDHIPPRWLSDQLTAPIQVKGYFDSKECSIDVKPIVEEAAGIDRTSYLKSIEILTKFGHHNLESLTRIYQGKDRETKADSIKLLSKVVFSSPFFLNEPHHYASFYHKSVQSKLLPKIFQFLQSNVAPQVHDIRLVDEFQRFLVDDERFEGSLDLTSYGEGLQRIFFTSLLFASAENGVVLIDEFENAIHADLIEEFSPFIYELANEFNVQVFLTSHSKECIDSFVENIPNEALSDFTFHALIASNVEDISIREFDGADFSKLLEAGNIDLRKAK